jgi:hypothetical protein
MEPATRLRKSPIPVILGLSEAASGQCPLVVFGGRNAARPRKGTQMPKSFSKITTDHGGKVLFFSKQDQVTSFFRGPLITNYEGICLALTMLWLAQTTSKDDPLKGTANKTKALNLQNLMEAGWQGFSTVEKKGTEIIGKHFWWKSTKTESISTTDPCRYLLNDPKNNREGLHILVLYLKPAHAVGVWRFPMGGVSFYDPNQGGAVLSHQKFAGFLTEFSREIYPEATKYAVCSWYSDPQT